MYLIHMMQNALTTLINIVRDIAFLIRVIPVLAIKKLYNLISSWCSKDSATTPTQADMPSPPSPPLTPIPPVPQALLHPNSPALTDDDGVGLGFDLSSDGANHGEAKKMAPYFHPFSIADFKKYPTL